MTLRKSDYIGEIVYKQEKLLPRISIWSAWSNNWHYNKNQRAITTLKDNIEMSSALNISFKRFWQSETGPRTVHFWAPALKWSLVIAGLSDISRPVEKVSGTQNLSLLATAVVWTRWSFVIKPRNMLLASVNFFLGCTAGFQIGRIIDYRLKNGDSITQTMKYIVKGENIVSAYNQSNADGNITSEIRNEITY